MYGERHLLCVGAAVIFVTMSAPLRAQSTWQELPNTQMRTVCPPNTAEYPFWNRCHAVIEAWSGGAFDTFRNRLIIWGGGHGDYYGNEIYALDLNSFSFQRLTDPSSGFVVGGSCVSMLPDGNPSSRHTYGGLAYIEHADRLFAYGGSQACGSGGFGADTWTFDFSTMKWERMQEVNSQIGNRIVAAAYDRVTQKVYLHNGNGFFTYDYDTNTWTRLNGNDSISSFKTAFAVVDPVRRKFVVVSSGQVYVIDLRAGSNYSSAILGTSGATTLMAEGRSPGLAYDAARDRIVGWNGADSSSTPDTVYSLDLDTGIWTAVAAPGGPVGGNTRGTFGRWRYAPKLNAFVVANDVDENAFLFNLGAGTLIRPMPPTNLQVQ